MILCLVIGVLCLGLGIHAGKDHGQEAHDIDMYGVGFICASLTLFVIYRTITWAIDC